VGGDINLRKSVGVQGDLSGEVDAVTLSDRIELDKLSPTFAQLQLTAMGKMYAEDSALLQEWRSWSKLDMQLASKQKDEGFIIWLKPAADRVTIPKKIVPPAPALAPASDEIDGDDTHSRTTKANPSKKTQQAALRVLELLKRGRIHDGGTFTDDCFKRGGPSLLFTEEREYCERLAAGQNTGQTVYNIRM